MTRPVVHHADSCSTSDHSFTHIQDVPTLLRLGWGSRAAFGAARAAFGAAGAAFGAAGAASGPEHFRITSATCSRVGLSCASRQSVFSVSSDGFRDVRAFEVGSGLNPSVRADVVSPGFSSKCQSHSAVRTVMRASHSENLFLTPSHLHVFEPLPIAPGEPWKLIKQSLKHNVLQSALDSLSYLQANVGDTIPDTSIAQDFAGCNM